MQQERRSGCGDECRNAWSGLENENVEKKEVRGEILAHQEFRIFQKNFMKTGVTRVWKGRAVDIALSDRLKLRRQMAAAAGNNLEVEEELSTMATLAWAEEIGMGRCAREQKKARRKQLFDVQTWRQVRGLRGQEQARPRRKEKKCMQPCNMQPAFTVWWKNGRIVKKLSPSRQRSGPS